VSADPYFTKMSEALRAGGFSSPRLVVDRDRLAHNIAAIKARLGAGLNLRIADKSLPCLPLMAMVREAFATELFMTFHPPVSATVAAAFPAADLLCGKPMPVAAARRALEGARGSESRIVWLIDTNERLAAYAALAEELGVDLRICFEVDVGLHRGGYADPGALAEALSLLRSHPRLKCEGIMGYEAHISKMPAFLGGPAKALAKTAKLFRQFAGCLDPSQRRIVNIGGSSTALLYDGNVGANEVTIGSAFVLPSDFDVASLGALKPAAFIATPILKTINAQMPGFDRRTWILQKLGLFPRRACFVYGGKWMAEPAHPRGMKTNSLFGYSTNQQFMALPDDCEAKPDDFAFFRPTQSEFVLQQFGPIVVFANGAIVEEWPVLTVG
jgi:D-serine deaminase-like pyridoxal phosphate-dependent protein